MSKCNVEILNWNFLISSGKERFYTFSSIFRFYYLSSKCQKMSNIDNITDYGRPMKPFFIEIQNVWAWADKLG